MESERTIMKPIIGITGTVDDKKLTGVLHSYVHAVECAGGIPLIIPYFEDAVTASEIVNALDGILFSGGADISPEIYGERIKPTDGDIQPYRDEVEIKIFEATIKTEKPILAICRGAQLVNALMGGTLYHDIPTEYKTDITHRQPGEQTDFCHEINVKDGTPLRGLLGKERILVNSWHHQGVKWLGDGLSVMASADDGIVEGFYLPGKRYLRGYQWHPEKTYERDEYSKKIFDEFISAAKEVTN